MKDKYSCFLHAQVGDYSEKLLSDLCPDCQKPYGFPIDPSVVPAQIGEYKILQPLARGYYGATYVAEKRNKITSKKIVLKVIPKETYKKFGKDFYEECKLHVEASKEAEHIVVMDDAFEEDVNYNNDCTIPSYIAILEYVEGITLKEYLQNTSSISLHTICQIAIDCLKILQELNDKSIFHNDLHLNNFIVSKLSKKLSRDSEIDPSIKLYAIDFGSSSGKSQSDAENKRLGDLHWVASILSLLSKQILEAPTNHEERDFRLALLLEERSKNVFPSTASQRIFSFEEVIEQIRQTYIQATSPWKDPLLLRNFNDSYNAQTLSPWFVPLLMVDDEHKWVSEISSRGPQVITGMRGCGKTMLIRALQFHARATPQNDYEKNNSKHVLERLNKDHYIGIYVSCTRLLDSLGSHDSKLKAPFERLFIAYAIETLSAVRHLRELSPKTVKQDAFIKILDVVKLNIDCLNETDAIFSEYEIEKFLLKILNSLNKGEENYKITSNPGLAFNELATTIRNITWNWANSYVLFLLDDVSTRFLNDNNIITLVSSLLFQNEICAFKFTTEAQTLEMVINSPGNIEQARIGRDYQIFDLGYEVNKKIHTSRSEGITFVEKILHKRSLYHLSHPNNVMPKDFLGDETLQNIALSISKEGKASSKKGLYHGITAMASVCVGDIGDVITLYEKILKKRKAHKLPVAPELQNEAYLELCNSRLFDINRRNSKLFDFAESFAEAAHHLLIQSYKKTKNLNNLRLRQYSSIFINVSTGDIDKQNSQIRELIDAGVFNFSGGPQASRTNRQGLNPQQQYKLTFRKIYGLNKHIGLSQSDRFELSGEALEEWLSSPKSGKEILIRNLAKDASYPENDGLDSSEVLKFPSKTFENNLGHQINLFENAVQTIDNEVLFISENSYLLEKIPTISSVNLTREFLSKLSNYISSFGFEDSTFESLKRILHMYPLASKFIEFEESGKRDEIIPLIEDLKISYSTIDYKSLKNEALVLESETLLDITGIPQSVIFKLVSRSLEKNNKINIAFTRAKQHYPLNGDIGKELEKLLRSDNKTEILASVSNLLKGEEGPYNISPLLNIETNHSLRRILIAFASPKHERLYTLLDEREFDKIIILTPKGKSSRHKFARIAAEIALSKYPNTEINNVEEYSIEEITKFIFQQYQTYFINQNFSFEIALSGNKIQALASAIVCQSVKVNQCWYIQPSKWDTKRFTKGAKLTEIFTIKKH